MDSGLVGAVADNIQTEPAMSKWEQEYIAKLRAHAAETRKLWSNENKPERERMIVRAFLRCIGVNFSDDELRTGSDPPDVVFRDAQFEVMEDLGGRKRGDEWRERERVWGEAKRLSDVVEPSTPSEQMPATEAWRKSVDALGRKALRYGAGVCSDFDALLHLDLKGQHLWPLEGAVDQMAAEQAAAHGWRSVCVLFPPYGTVICAHAGAPTFLKDAVGQTLAQWLRPAGEGLFDP